MQSRTHSHPVPLVLVLAGLAALDLAAVRPAAAQSLTYTLNDVTFNDGATASGYFDFNPATQTFGNFDITTTDGTTDGLMGANYPSQACFAGYDDNSIYPASPQFSVFNFSLTVEFPPTGRKNFLALYTDGIAAAPGTFTLRPGSIIDAGQYRYSVETAPTTIRTIETGSLLVTPAAAVPEASTTVSLGLLLALGLGSGVIAAKKKKTAAA